MNRTLILAAAAAAAFSAVGCSGGPDLEARLDELSREREDLERRNATLEGQLAAAEAKAASLERKVRGPAAEKPAADVQLDDELTRRGVSLKRRGNDTIIDIPADVTFASGSSVLSRDGERVVREVLDLVKKDFAGSMIRVEGHSDADPIRRTKSKYHCNWELSFERAHAVAHYLVEKGGLDPKRLAVDCYGEHQPQDARNKSKNRRVEIVIEQ